MHAFGFYHRFYIIFLGNEEHNTKCVAKTSKDASNGVYQIKRLNFISSIQSYSVALLPFGRIRLRCATCIGHMFRCYFYTFK